MPTGRRESNLYELTNAATFRLAVETQRWDVIAAATRGILEILARDMRTVHGGNGVSHEKARGTTAVTIMGVVPPPAALLTAY